MNEFLFLAHIWIVIGFALGALRFGSGALTAFIALQGVLANLFVVKQIHLFGFSVTCSDVFAIGGILSLNLLQEYFGKDAAKRAVKISLGALLFFAAMSQIHLLYAPTALDTTHDSFLNIFSSSMRIVAASLATFFIVQQFDVRFFSFLKGKLPIRIAISLFTSQLLDTILFSVLGLYGLVESLFDIIFMSFMIKCLIILASSPFTAFSKRFVKLDIEHFLASKSEEGAR
ncbi:MAG: queuosine precursor transporter [Parachlamydiales bacterium]|nr:queuosine precursor transporter [Parachlamydiales bacterium]